MQAHSFIAAIPEPQMLLFNHVDDEHKLIHLKHDDFCNI